MPIGIYTKNFTQLAIHFCIQIGYIQKESILTDSYLMEVIEPQVQIGLNVKALRLERGLSRQKLATKAGMSHSGIVNIEQGDRMPKGDTLKALAKAFGIAWEDIIYYHRIDPAQRGLIRIDDEELLAILSKRLKPSGS